MSEPATGLGIDRAAAARRALRTLVAERGLHGASISAVVAESRVATGTIYTHYASKDELVLAAYIETKIELGAAATAGLHRGGAAGDRFRAIWLNTYRHLAAHRDDALFLLQIDYSPYKARAYAAVMDTDLIVEEATTPDMAARLVPLPLEVIYELGLAPAVRLAAAGTELSDAELRAIADACWRAISVP